jgi:hypothetical protein
MNNRNTIISIKNARVYLVKKGYFYCVEKCRFRNFIRGEILSNYRSLSILFFNIEDFGQIGRVLNPNLNTFFKHLED